MNLPEEQSISLHEGRFARLEAIEWWDQSLLHSARVLVIGAGALGNEVIKNLSLLGVGNLVVVDMDHIELSNLSRSVLFRESDEGKPKAVSAVNGAKAIYPNMNITPIVGNVTTDVGFGYFRWAQIVVGALDNREARIFVNSASARVGRPWIDGGIEVLHGIVRGFFPPETACYECTMSQNDWDLINQRRSCGMLAQRAIAQQGTPTTPTTASVIGAIQVQEVVKLLHGINGLIGRAFIFEGLAHSSYSIDYQIKPGCMWHESPPTIESVPSFNSDTPFSVIRDFACERLNGFDSIDFGREILDKMQCSSCGKIHPIFQQPGKIFEDELKCEDCGKKCAPTFIHSIHDGSELLDKTAKEIGLPSWDIVWARKDENCIGIEITGDKPIEMQPDIAKTINRGEV